MNLFTVADWLTAFGQADIHFDPARCLHRGDRNATCQACVEVCPSGALTAGKPPVFHEAKCINCDACLSACPSGAFHASDPLAQLIQNPRAEGSGILDLYCPRHPRSQTGPAESTGYRVKVCLAGLSAGSYLFLVAQGYRRVWVRTDACRDCPLGGLAAQIETQVAHARRLLALWGLDNALALLPSLDTPLQRPLWSLPASARSEVSRRDLFRMAARRTELPTRPAVPQPRPVANAEHLSRDRVQLLQAASQFQSPLRDPNGALEGLGFASLTVSQDCTACRACARVCPTGALRFTTDEAETAFRLSFLAESCIGCEACLHVCSPAALAIDHAPGARAVLETHQAADLYSGRLARCERCQTPFAAQAGQHLCALCAYRAAHPFGSILPEELSRMRTQAGALRTQAGKENRA